MVVLALVMILVSLDKVEVMRLLLVLEEDMIQLLRKNDRSSNDLVFFYMVVKLLPLLILFKTACAYSSLYSYQLSCHKD